MSRKSEPQDLLGLFLAHAHQAFQVERAIVISREGLEHPDFRVLLSAGCGEQPTTTMVADPGILMAGGLLAELLYDGQFRTVTPLVLDGAEPAGGLLAGGRSLVAFPLYGHGESVGMVVLISPSERTCREVELCGLALLAALLQRTDDPPPRLVRAGDRAVLSIDGARSLPLGMLAGRPPRVEELVVLGAGDLLLFYGDGITEVRSRGGEFFGTERLDRVLLDLPRPASPVDAIQAVMRAVEEFADGEAPEDDQTLLAVQWLGDGGEQDAGVPSGGLAVPAGGAVA
ncbi:MAG: serine/threonine-protein phosphatase [Planctomycetes bacterium]|nr:serine/threonine-protein phosphatase [Planctomycetota bacterium]